MTDGSNSKVIIAMLAETPTPEVERLRVERDGFVQYGAARDEENAVLRARVKRLEGALKAYVAFGCPVCAGDCASVNPQPTHCPTSRARAALGGE